MTPLDQALARLRAVAKETKYSGIEGEDARLILDALAQVERERDEADRKLDESAELQAEMATRTDAAEAELAAARQQVVELQAEVDALRGSV